MRFTSTKTCIIYKLLLLFHKVYWVTSENYKTNVANEQILGYLGKETRISKTKI